MRKYLAMDFLEINYTNAAPLVSPPLIVLIVPNFQIKLYALPG